MSISRCWVAALAIGSLVSSLSTGCIESQRTLASPDADTAEPGDGDADVGDEDTVADTAEPPEDTTTTDTSVRPDVSPDTEERDTVIAPDSVEPDTVEADTVTPDTMTPDTAGPYCDEADECEPGPCQTARCVDHACVYDVAEPNTPCDNGSGQAPGSCINGGFQPPDHCGGNGICVDGSPDLASDVPLNWLAGQWFFVNSTVAVPDTNSVTYRGYLAVDISGDITLTANGSSAQNGGSLPSAVGNICFTDARDVRVELNGGRVLRGAATEDAEILAVSGVDDRSLLIATRGWGEPEDITGTYDFVTTSLEPADTLRTWAGTLSFHSGCQDANGTMYTSANGQVQPNWTLPLSADDNVGCFTLAEDAPAPLQISLQITPLGGSDAAGIRWRGAASDGGGLVILTRDDAAPNPRYGTIVMVRRPAVNGIQGHESWSVAFHGRRAAGTELVGERGTLGVGTDSSISGRLWWTGSIGAQDVTGTADDGASGLTTLQVAYAASDAAFTARYVGRRASREDVMLFYTVDDDSAVGFELVPAAPSLGLLVRRAPPAPTTPTE